jgi:hypothetical protein
LLEKRSKLFTRAAPRSRESFNLYHKLLLV